MASYSSSKLFFFFLFLSTFRFLSITCTQFEVGGENGWKTPNSKDDREKFNKWASKNRFIVGDSLHFTYKKDSVLEVTEEDYEKCHSTHPNFFSNNGNTVFTLDRSGLFYFISGISGHCERGQKLVVKVLEPVANTPDQSQSPSQNSTTDHKSQGIAIGTFAISSPTILFILLSSIGVLFA